MADSADDADIVIKMNDDMQFDPEFVTITTGTTVRFENTGERMVHTVTCDPTLAADPDNVVLPTGVATWNSGNIEPGATWRYRFDEPGEYRYVCLPHELAGMVGTIIVEDE